MSKRWKIITLILLLILLVSIGIGIAISKNKEDDNEIDIGNYIAEEKVEDECTEICFSMKDAVQAAADIYGCLSEIEIHKLFSFFHEMVYKETENIQTFDITFKKKEGV